ncbi:MAG: bifunctional folylpolyglutamate synthase/dihydrofolate synthase [Dehalococcoidia bacterium]|tara:strand:+ start:1643 stop:3001 length:1359 start_codon:yes stop_codon:yes gene_type:complete
MQNSSTKDKKAYINVVKDLTNRSNFEKNLDKKKGQNWKVTHIKEYLEKNRNFEARNTIHLAGSKGKGSTAHFINNIFLESKKNVLLYTSPDLHSVTERILLNGKQISKKLFVQIASKYTQNTFFDNWSYFELMTIIAWEAAQIQNCEWQIIETGLGGRLDATNALGHKIVNIITPIELEHTEILGDTLEKISSEKTGIIHKGENVVVSKMSEEATKIIKEKINLIGTKQSLVNEECQINYKNQSIEYQILDIHTPITIYKNIKLKNIGTHQAENAATAIRACEIAWRKIYKEDIPVNYVLRGLTNTIIPGRIEKIKEKPLILIDSMHTVLSAKKLEETLSNLQLPKKRVIIFGALENKNVNKIAKVLCKNNTDIIVTKPISKRSMSINKVKKIFDKYCANVVIENNLKRAIRLISNDTHQDRYFLIVGSTYLIAEAREIILSIDGDRKLNLR